MSAKICDLERETITSVPAKVLWIESPLIVILTLTSQVCIKSGASLVTATLVNVKGRLLSYGYETDVVSLRMRINEVINVDDNDFFVKGKEATHSLSPESQDLLF